MSNVPKLRFKEFSGEWEEKQFGEIYNFFQTNSFSRALLNYENGSVRNIHYGDIHTKFKSNFFIDKEEVPFINTDVNINNIKEENYCIEKDLIIADASEDYKDIGKTLEIIKLDNQKLLAGLHTYIARDTKDEMALGFGGYFMQTNKVRLQMMKLATGISVLGISKGNLLKMSLVVPLKKEQEKIASFLTSVDTKIEQITHKEELLQQYKKGVMQKIFNQEIRFKADDGSEFEEWEEKKLKEVCIIYGRIGYRGYTVKDIVQPGEGAITISPSNIINGKTVFEKNTYISWFKYDESPEIQIFNGDIIFVKTASIGKIAFVNNLSEKATINPQIVVLKKILLNNKYLSYYLMTDTYQKQVKQISAGGVMPTISQADLKETLVLSPSLEEQTKITNFLSSIDSKIEQVQQQLNSTKAFKKALLQQMFV